MTATAGEGDAQAMAGKIESARGRIDARAVQTMQEPERTILDVAARLEALRAQQALALLAPHHRVVLVLRYRDDMSVRQVAAELGRTRHATKALRARARAAFRPAYEGSSGRDD